MLLASVNRDLANMAAVHAHGERQRVASILMMSMVDEFQWWLMLCGKLGGIDSGDAAGLCIDPDGQWLLWVFITDQNLSHNYCNIGELA